MIGRLRGRVLTDDVDSVVLDVNGVGYELSVPLGTIGRASPTEGGEVVVFVHTHVREDQLALYGFATEADRAAFRVLLSVSSVGPKTALAVTSALPADDLARAIAAKDVTKLTSIPGIGKKTAERLVLELRDKLPSALPAAKAAAPHGPDVLNALLSLGYNAREASAAIRGLPPELALADAIRQALKVLAKP